MRRPWAAGPSQAAALFPLFVRDVSDESGPWDPVCYKHKPGGEFLLPSLLPPGKAMAETIQRLLAGNEEG